MFTLPSVSLAEKDLWMEKFPWMEMTARNSLLTPGLKFLFEGLEKDQQYKMVLSIERYGDTRWAFDAKTTSWGVSEVRNFIEPSESKRIEHPLGVQSGEKWMDGVIDFGKIKISSNEKHKGLDKVFIPHTGTFNTPTTSIYGTVSPTGCFCTPTTSNPTNYKGIGPSCQMNAAQPSGQSSYLNTMPPFYPVVQEYNLLHWYPHHQYNTYCYPASYPVFNPYASPDISSISPQSTASSSITNSPTLSNNSENTPSPPNNSS
uniref:T-box domain-containing protein n=1 Tax=Caenorhabditis tropicalis TaxID=1561998 RepID=A0A1I7V487_9PELO